MEFEQYRNNDPRAVRPSPPTLPRNPNSADYRKHADAMEDYEKKKEAYDLYNSARFNKINELREKFKKDLLEEFDLDKHKNAEKIYAYAAQHSDGNFQDIYDTMNDLAELFD